MTKYDLDLTQSAFVKTRGDLTLYGCWHGKHLRPCLSFSRHFAPTAFRSSSSWTRRGSGTQTTQTLTRAGMRSWSASS